MRTLIAALFACLTLYSSCANSAESAERKAGSIETEERSVKLKSGDVVDYEVGTLYVRENRMDADSRLIGVGFARFPAEVDPRESPPLFLLPGGPGGSYVSRLKDGAQRERMIRTIARWRSFTDVVFVDQRGFSEAGDVLRATFRPPAIRRDRPFTQQIQVSAFEKFASEAVEKYKDSPVDLRGYTVKECAHDVDQLRSALGYDEIVLNGTSFGSQWSFAVMRLHPKAVARALLSGVEPLDCGYDMPSYVFAAVQRMWRAVERDPKFQPYLPEGGMAEAARVVIERLERDPIKLELRDDEGKQQVVGVLGPLNFPWNRPQHILELYHDHTERWRRGFVAQLMSRRPNTVELIGPLIDSSLGVTPERRHRLWTDPATRYLGRSNFASYLATAEIWPSPDVGDEFRTPELCDIPVVFAQGTWDTQTPLENTFEIATFFPNSRVLIAERGGHGVLESIHRQHPKVSGELIEFVRNGDQQGIPARVTMRPSRSFTPPKFPPPK